MSKAIDTINALRTVIGIDTTPTSGSTDPITSGAVFDALAGKAGTDTIYTHPTTDGNLHVPATGTTNSGKVLTAGATAGSLSWETPNASGSSSFASIWKYN